MNGTAYLEDVSRDFSRLRRAAEDAIAQVPAGQLARPPAPGANSIAVLMKHIGGNLRSRWTDFLMTDGEKPDRDRDAEFEDAEEGRDEDVRALWNLGWDALSSTLTHLADHDLEATVRIRGESLGVVSAIQRSIAHTALHVGQIVYAAKILAGPEWRTLSIPRGGSKAFNRNPKPYLPPR